MISNDKKAVIHIAKAQVGMTQAEYLDLLGSVGAESSKDLSDRTFAKVMRRFEELGFRSTSKTRKRARKVKTLPRSRREIMSKIEAILLDMGLPWAYVDGIAKKRFKVDTAQWLDADDLFKVLQMMIYHQRRNGSKRRD